MINDILPFMFCVELVEYANISIVLIGFTNQIWLKIAPAPDNSIAFRQTPPIYVLCF